MAWSPSKLPDVLASTCGWPSTSVMSSLCDSRGCPLLAGSAIHTWLACLVLRPQSQLLQCAPGPWSPRQGSNLIGTGAHAASGPVAPFGVYCRLFCVFFSLEIKHWPEVRGDSQVWRHGGGLGEFSGCEKCVRVGWAMSSADMSTIGRFFRASWSMPEDGVEIPASPAGSSGASDEDLHFLLLL